MVAEQMKLKKGKQFGSGIQEFMNVCPKWFGKSKLEQSGGATCLRGANGKPLQEYGRDRSV